MVQGKKYSHAGQECLDVGGVLSILIHTDPGLECLLRRIVGGSHCHFTRATPIHINALFPFT